MRERLASIPLLVYLIIVLLAASVHAQDREWRSKLADWRTHHALELKQPDSWFALIGLEWLQAGENSFGSAPDNKIHLPSKAPAHVGLLRLENNSVFLDPPASGFPEGLSVGGKPAEPQALHIGTDSDKDNPRLTIGSLTMYVIKRGERHALRIRDSQSQALMNFRGLKWFPPNARYRVTARWIPYVPSRMTTLATLVGTSYSRPVPGAAEFMLYGKTYRLEPVVEDPAEAKLFFVIRDLTSKSTTYGACRFLYTAYPDNDLTQPGKLVLDFNYLENPPCAYTAHATCPLPPKGNRLPILLPVGEKRYHR